MNASVRTAATSRGFSLVEVTLALAMIASVLISLMLVMGMASDAAARATRLTTIGHILTDAHQRIEGLPMKDGPLKGTPFYYDGDGVFIPIDAPEDVLVTRIYSVEAELATPHAAHAPDARGLKALTLRLRWPVDGASGRSLSDSAANTETMTSFVTSLTGPGWEKVDANFQPRIDL